MTSTDILSKLSPLGTSIIEGPGTLREKWARLSDDDKQVMEEAIAAAGSELEKIQAMMAKSGLATKQEIKS